MFKRANQIITTFKILDPEGNGILEAVEVYFTNIGTGNPQILSMPRNQPPADELIKYLAVYIKSLGFAANFEDEGMLRLPL
jgi:hypothetical protein